MTLRSAVAAALAAHCLQMLASRLAGAGPVSASFFFVHLAWVLGLYLAAAGACRVLRAPSAWVGAAGTLPLLAVILASAGVGSRGLAAASTCALVGLALTRRLPATAALPAAVLGAGSAAALRYFRVEHYVGRRTALGALALLVALLAGAALLAALMHLARTRFPKALSFAVLVAVLPGIAYWASVERRSHEQPGTRAVSTGRPPMVLIVLDTVRADHLRSYGYERETMPELERFARAHMVRVERSVANSSWTIPTHASMFTGLVPTRHGAGMGPLPVTPSESRSLRSDNVTLAELLSSQGYRTAAVSANHAAIKKEFGLARGFASFRSEPERAGRAKLLTPWTLASKDKAPLARLDACWPFDLMEFFEAGVPYRRARVITDDALEFVDRSSGEPFFLFLNYMDAHWPYRAPQPAERRYAGARSRPADGWTTRAFHEVLEDKRDLAPVERQELVDLYDAELTYLDGHLGRLLRRLEANPRWADMIVVVTSDHGEAFGEHRLIHHSRALYEELLATPLFIKTGRTARPATNAWPGPLQSVDIFATLLELAGLPVPEGVDGSAWGRGRTTNRAWVDPDETARPNPARFNRSLRSIERDGFKLIESSLGGVELFDLRHDPRESVNLAERQPALVAELRQALGPWTFTSSAAPALQKERAEELRALGYVQ